MPVAKVIRYTTKPEWAQENERLIRDVFAELATDQPDGLRYAAFRLDDGLTFMHVAVLDDQENPLTASAAFGKFQAGMHPLARVGQLTGRRHYLDGVRVRLGLVQVDLSVKRLLADPLALRRSSGDPLKELVDRRVELVGRHDLVDQAPVERRRRIDHIARQRHLCCPLPPDIPGDRDHRRVAEPAALAAWSGEPGVLAGDREIGGRDQLTARRRGQPVHACDDGLGNLLHQRHELGAGLQQRSHSCQVRIGNVGEVVTGAEYRAVAREHNAERIAGTDLGERIDELTHVREGQGVATLRPVHRDGGELAGPVDQNVLELHGGLPLQCSLRPRPPAALTPVSGPSIRPQYPADQQGRPPSGRAVITRPGP